MAYLKPNWVTARVFNPIAKFFGMGETLTVTARSTKKPQRIPIITVDVNREHSGDPYPQTPEFFHDQIAKGGRHESQ